MKRNKLIISLAIFAVWVVILFAESLSQGGHEHISLDDATSKQISIPLVVAPAFLLAVVAWLGWWREVGLKPADPTRSWRLLWFPAIFVLGFLGTAAILGLPPTQTIIFVLINTMLVGVSEELMFRGVILHGALSRFNIWPAILLTTVLFGAVHVLNGFTTGDFLSSMAQAMAATLSGMYFLALRLRTRSLFPGMLIHGLFDFALMTSTVAMRTGRLPTTEGSAALSFPLNFVAPIIFILPLFIYGLWLLRGVGKVSKDEL